MKFCQPDRSGLVLLVFHYPSGTKLVRIRSTHRKLVDSWVSWLRCFSASYNLTAVEPLVARLLTTWLLGIVSSGCPFWWSISDFRRDLERNGVLTFERPDGRTLLTTHYLPCQWQPNTKSARRV